MHAQSTMYDGCVKTHAGTAASPATPWCGLHIEQRVPHHNRQAWGAHPAAPQAQTLDTLYNMWPNPRQTQQQRSRCATHLSRAKASPAERTLDQSMATAWSHARKMGWLINGSQAPLRIATKRGFQPQVNSLDKRFERCSGSNAEAFPRHARPPQSSARGRRRAAKQTRNAQASHPRAAERRPHARSNMPLELFHHPLARLHPALLQQRDLPTLHATADWRSAAAEAQRQRRCQRRCRRSAQGVMVAPARRHASVCMVMFPKPACANQARINSQHTGGQSASVMRKDIPAH